MKLNLKCILFSIILVLTSNFFFLCKEKEKIIFVRKPLHIPQFAFKASDADSDWFYIDNSLGYYATWDKDGILLTEIFLVSNLTERIMKSYHENGKPRRISTFKSFRNVKIPEDTIELAESEPDYYKKRKELRYFPSKFYLIKGESQEVLYPRAFFGILVWDSGPDYVFAQGKVYSKECSTIKEESYESPSENCGEKIIYSLDGTETNNNYPLKCNHSCSDKTVSLKRGKYKITSIIEAPIFSKPENNSVEIATVKEDEMVEVLGEPIYIPEINFENFSWIKIRNKSIVGYIKKSNLTNKPLN